MEVVSKTFVCRGIVFWNFPYFPFEISMEEEKSVTNAVVNELNAIYLLQFAELTRENCSRDERVEYFWKTFHSTRPQNTTIFRLKFRPRNSQRTGNISEA